jgi:hypothetical protein
LRLYIFLRLSSHSRWFFLRVINCKP